MADEPDNLMLRLLREIRAELQEIKAKQAEHDQRFATIDQRFVTVDQRFVTMAEHIDERFDEMRDVLTHTFGLVGTNDLKLREHNARLRDNDSWRKRTDASIATIESRLGKLEDPS